MKNFFKLIRWKNLFIVVLTMFAMRWLVIFPVYCYYHIDVAFPAWGFCFLVLATLFVAAGGYAINNYFDRKNDIANNLKNVIVGFKISKRKVIAMHFWLNLIGFLCGIAVAISVHKFWYVFIFLFIEILLWWYSILLKKRPFIGNLLISILVGFVPFFVGMTEYFAVENTITQWDINYVRAVKFSFQIIISLSFFGFIYNLIREIIKDCEDYEGDKVTNVHSLPVVWGRKKTNYLISALSFLGLVAVTFFLHFYILNINIFTYYTFQTYYIYIFIIIPTIYLIIKSLFGISKSKYTILSRLTKAIMVFGILFTIIFCFIVYDNIY